MNLVTLNGHLYNSKKNGKLKINADYHKRTVQTNKVFLDRKEQLSFEKIKARKPNVSNRQNEIVEISGLHDSREHEVGKPSVSWSQRSPLVNDFNDEGRIVMEVEDA